MLFRCNDAVFVYMLETIQCSIFLQGIAVVDTGLLFTSSHFLPFYKQGTPEHQSNEMVVCHAGTTDKTAPHSITVSFRNMAGTLSRPSALLGFIFCNCLLTPSMSN